MIAFEPDVSIFYAYRGAAKAIGGDTPGALADFDRVRTIAIDADDIGAIDEKQREVGL